MAALIPIAAAAYGAGLSAIGQDKANKENAKQAQLNRDFQERMSSTQYQRAVRDLRMAGLNPALAYQQGGASAPSGSSAAAMQNTLSGAASQATSLIPQALQLAQIQNIKANTSKTEEEALQLQLARTPNYDQKVWDVRSSAAGVALTDQQIRNLTQQRDEILERVKSLSAANKYAVAGAYQDYRMKVASADEAEQKALTAKFLKRLTELGIPEAQAMADYYSGVGGKAAPYIGSAQQIVSMLVQLFNPLYGAFGPKAPMPGNRPLVVPKGAGIHNW